MNSPKGFWADLFSKERNSLFLLIPFLGIAWVWTSSLSFVPVPWPDDSAFYFPAKDLFSYPPHWIMTPQAPFEPTYREWNFNTMPLFPVLIGIFRAVGIDGSHALKLLPLAGWLCSTVLILNALVRDRANRFVLIGAALLLTFDPVLRWHSVLMRPESWIGAMGVFLVIGYRFGWPHFLRERRYFHPASLALWTGAMLHFNALHLVSIVIVLYFGDWRKILKIGALTAAGLLPWVCTVALHFDLFQTQMALQFNRLVGYENPWLTNLTDFENALIPDMGSPEPWPHVLKNAFLFCVLALPLLVGTAARIIQKTKNDHPQARSRVRTLTASFTWLLSALYLWHTKAEVWFTGYFHLAYWLFALLVLHEISKSPVTFPGQKLSKLFSVFPLLLGGLFFYETVAQAARLSADPTWRWDTYGEWVNCVDRFLVQEHRRKGAPEKFRVWGPTFPDILIELSRKHPKWEFTRTNDFTSRSDLALAHGKEVDAVVVTEFYRHDQRTSEGKLTDYPEARSVWMNWEGYFLNTLQRDPNFKPNRNLCQRGRWDAFIYFK
ncbi:MAG: hypothetical protein H7301_03995 [Cryobacterium sp.]|nr:hypothetical protein [Oligoflexia bacterium]